MHEQQSHHRSPRSHRHSSAQAPQLYPNLEKSDDGRIHPLKPTNRALLTANRYLPTMALIAVGMIYLPNNLFSTAPPPSPRTVTLDSANRKIGFAIANALEEHNLNRKRKELTQTEKNRLLLDAYGARSTLEDIEHAFQQIERSAALDQTERNRLLDDAYGERDSLRDVQRAMQVYEVQ